MESTTTRLSISEKPPTLTPAHPSRISTSPPPTPANTSRGLNRPTINGWRNRPLSSTRRFWIRTPLPPRINSAKGIAYLYLNLKQFEDAKRYYQQTWGFDPNDPEPYYSIGVVDWTLCYQPRMEARANLGLRPDEHLDARKREQKNLCDEPRAKNRALIEEGMDSLNRAIQLGPDYDDAMAYLNLMFRERADLECEDPAARRDDLKQADHWVDRTVAVKKARAGKNLTAMAPSPQ